MFGGSLGGPKWKPPGLACGLRESSVPFSSALPSNTKFKNASS